MRSRRPPTFSSVHASSAVTSVSGRQPSSSWMVPPCTFTTWPEMPSRRVRRQPAGDGGDVLGGEPVEAGLVGLQASLPSASVRRVRATGAMALTRTPSRSSSRAMTIVIEAMPALAAA